jgi:hypothetical protein
VCLGLLPVFLAACGADTRVASAFVGIISRGTGDAASAITHDVSIAVLPKHCSTFFYDDFDELEDLSVTANGVPLARVREPEAANVLTPCRGAGFAVTLEGRVGAADDLEVVVTDGFGGDVVISKPAALFSSALVPRTRSIARGGIFTFDHMPASQAFRGAPLATMRDAFLSVHSARDDGSAVTAQVEPDAPLGAAIIDVIWSSDDATLGVARLGGETTCIGAPCAATVHALTQAVQVVVTE